MAVRSRRSVCRLGMYKYRSGMNTVASICLQKEVLMFAQRLSWNTQTETGRYPESEVDSCKYWSCMSRRMHKLSETKERWTSLRHFSRWTDHDSKEQSKSKEQEQHATRHFVNWVIVLLDGELLQVQWRRLFARTILCLCTRRDGHFDTLEWPRWSCTNQNHLADRRACWVLCTVFD